MSEKRSSVEVVSFFVVSYYPNNQMNTAPTVFYPLLRDYNAALAFANATMITNSGVGCCLIQEVQGTLVFTPHVFDVS